MILNGSLKRRFSQPNNYEPSSFTFSIFRLKEKLGKLGWVKVGLASPLCNVMTSSLNTFPGAFLIILTGMTVASPLQ